MTQVAMPAAVGDATAAAVFVTVLTKGPIARSEIASVLNLSAGTISRAVRPLLDAGYLAEDDPGSLSRPGRPMVPLRVVADREFVVGIKLAGDHIVGVVVDLLAEVRASRELSIVDKSASSVVSLIADMVADLRSDVSSAVTRIGIGVGGHVDPRSQLVRYAPFLNWHDVPLAALVSAATGVPTAVENDVNALTVAEQWFGSGVDVPTFAVVTIGVGIGCGLVMGGALVHGAIGLAGELGHVPIAADGLVCRCGNAGCIETTASEDAILRRVRADSGRDDLDIHEVVALARSGKTSAVAAFAAAGEALGRALAVVANLINPERILLSGEGLAASDLFETAARESFATHAFGRAADCELITRPLPDHTWARGAAAVAIQHLFLNAVSDHSR